MWWDFLGILLAYSHFGKQSRPFFCSLKMKFPIISYSILSVGKVRMHMHVGCGTTFWWSPFQVRMQLCYTVYIVYSVGTCSCVASVLEVLSSDLFSMLYYFGWLFSCLFEQRVSSCRLPRRRNQKNSRNSVLCLSINLHIYSLCLCQMSRNWGK